MNVGDAFYYAVRIHGDEIEVEQLEGMPDDVGANDLTKFDLTIPEYGRLEAYIYWPDGKPVDDDPSVRAIIWKTLFDQSKGETTL